MKRIVSTHRLFTDSPTTTHSRAFSRRQHLVSRPLALVLGDAEMSWVGGECESRMAIRTGVRQVMSISNRSRRRYVLTCPRAGDAGRHLLDGIDVHMQLCQVWGEVQVDTQGIRMLDLEPGSTITLVFCLDGSKRAAWRMHAREESGAPVLMPLWVV